MRLPKWKLLSNAGMNEHNVLLKIGFKIEGNGVSNDIDSRDMNRNRRIPKWF